MEHGEPDFNGESIAMTEYSLPSTLPSWIADHVRLYLEDPEKARMWDSAVAGGPGPLPTLLLVSTGRQSGEPRPLPLIYGRSGDSYVVIASKGGAPDHPAWYLNLVVNPECEIHVGTLRTRARARTAEGAEREELWKRLTEIYPPYDDYQVSAGERRIPVVVLEPAGS